MKTEVAPETRSSWPQPGLVLNALLARLNHRFVGLPITMGVMVSALLLSLAVVGLDALGIDSGRCCWQVRCMSIGASSGRTGGTWGHWPALLTWNGLPSGISVAPALSLPAGPERNIVPAMTHCIVVFSIIGQGLTIGRVVRAAVTQRR